MSAEEKAGQFDPDMANQVNLSNPPDNNDGCLKPDDLQSYLDIDQFNAMMSNVTNTANDFLTNFMTDQQKAAPVVDEDTRYRATALAKLRELTNQHNNIIEKLKKDYKYYIASIEGFENTKQLFKMIELENKKLKKLIEEQIHIIELSDRKTYYENEQNDWAGWWSNQLKTKYWYLIFLLIMGIILGKKTANIKNWIFVALLTIYPIFIFFIIKMILFLWKWFKTSTTWVYLESNI